MAMKAFTLGFFPLTSDPFTFACKLRVSVGANSCDGSADAFRDWFLSEFVPADYRPDSTHSCAPNETDFILPQSEVFRLAVLLGGPDSVLESYSMSGNIWYMMVVRFNPMRRLRGSTQSFYNFLITDDNVKKEETQEEERP